MKKMFFLSRRADRKSLVAAMHDGGVKAAVSYLESAEVNNVKLYDEDLSLAFIMAVWLNEIDLVRFLLEKGVDVNTRVGDDDTALIKASVRGYEQVISLLIEWQANPNIYARNGYSALMHLLTKNKADSLYSLISKLVQAGAFVDLCYPQHPSITVDFSMTLLSVVVRSNSPLTLELLLNNSDFTQVFIKSVRQELSILPKSMYPEMYQLLLTAVSDLRM